MTKRNLRLIQGEKTDSLIGEPPPGAEPAPDEGMVWVNWPEGPAGWEYLQDITS